MIKTRSMLFNLAVLSVMTLTAAVLSATAFARVGPTPPDVGRFSDTLTAVPHPAYNSGVSAQANLILRGDLLTTIVRGSGLSPNLPHAMHIHGRNSPEVAMCPDATRADDITNDGLIETAEGLPDYGPILVSFTETGDTSPASGLALPRFPFADSSGNLRYERTFTIPADVASRLGDMEIVIHGADDVLSGVHDGSYDGPISALGVPIEAELPVACGHINGR